MWRILVSGVSGPIGGALVPSLKANGARVARLTRGNGNRSGAGSSTAGHGSNHEEARISWDPAKPITPEAVSGFQAVIHLAGETIVGRWTEAKKARIRDSRIEGTRHLAEALALASEKPQVFVCSSAIGYYGNRGDEILKEDSSPGEGFLPQVCQEWEAATDPAAQAGIRTVQMRTGVVLTRHGGALGKMLLPFKLGVGGNVGSGRQWMSWIDIEDMVGAIHHILNNDLLHGPVNMVAPKPVTNAEFTKTLGNVLSRPTIFPLPEFAVKTVFGQMGEEVLLWSERVEPTKLIMNGYPFRFRELRTSLRHVLGG
ncbi:MAG TPA: TIGR01777 family oxidoreductase [Candidatus Sulfotelmatobacter sp.]|nr:TIGR01777 family oxidoreductase [Candidatus Sulfotelmatobacter sp.]